MATFNNNIPGYVAPEYAFQPLPELPALPPIVPTTVPATSTSQGPPAQLSDGTFTDAQVEFSNQLMAAGQSQMEMENMMFQQQLMTMQSRASSQRLSMNRPRQAPEQPQKLDTGPELKSSIFDDSGDGGDGGDE